MSGALVLGPDETAWEVERDTGIKLLVEGDLPDAGRLEKGEAVVLTGPDRVLSACVMQAGGLGWAGAPLLGPR